MATYSYIAKSLKGESIADVKEAKDEKDLARIVHQEGYILISAKIVNGVNKRKFFNPFSKGVPLSEKIFFSRNLKMMITAGISLPRALNILSEQTKNKKFKNTLFKIAEEINKGKNFSLSLSSYPSIFSELFVNMIRVGEEGGTLDEALSALTNQMEKEYELKSKIKSALIYPSVIICAMILIGILMLALVVPRLAQTFNDLGVELPITTRMVIGTGNFIAHFWYLLPLIFFFIFFSFKILLQTKQGKNIFNLLSLRLPLISPLVKKSNSAATVRTLSSLISAGVPIIRSLEITAGTLTNVYYKNAILDAAEQVKKGAKLGEILKKYKDIYPTLVSQMVEIGEETGETTSILKKLADFFEEEVTRMAQGISSVIEPVLMLLIGAVVGLFAISMIQPIYSMIQSF